MRNYFRHFIITIIFLNLAESTYSQQSKDFIKLKIHVLGKQINCDTLNLNDQYFAIASIKNNQDSAISFWIMNGGWPIYNWQIDNELVSINFPGSDINNPIKITLKPKQQINFNILLQSKENRFKNLKFRLGFRYFPTIEQFRDNKHMSDTKVFWTNFSILEDNLFQAYYEK